ncbi:MAG: response regulator [Gammaproteobacteria bacterium]|nr:response regulator [Gammaproteobacteria bacterium]
MNDIDSQRILVVEDEAKLVQVLQDYLADAGYTTFALRDGKKVIPWVRENQPDLILLDIMLPGMDGLEICRGIRSFSQVPIIFITARVEEIDRLLGLELGGDDYICKPFSPREAIARIKAVMRRLATPGHATPGGGVVTLDENSHRVWAGDRSVVLTTVEFKLLETLYREPGRIYSRGYLMDRIYKDSRVVSDRTIDSHIKKLRKKLAGLLPDMEIIQSVYGAGYRYEPAPAAGNSPGAEEDRTAVPR